MEVKDKIEKVLFMELRKLPSNKALLWPSFQAAFRFATGLSLQHYTKEVQEVVDALEKSGYARFEQLPNGMIRIIKGVNFDEWENR